MVKKSKFAYDETDNLLVENPPDPPLTGAAAERMAALEVIWAKRDELKQAELDLLDIQHEEHDANE